GEPGAETYCAGVSKDVASYHSFLLSPIGGLWQDSEITRMDRPTKFDLKLKLFDFTYCDYALVIFAGHGFHSVQDNSTFIELRTGHDFDSKDLRLKVKQTLILDCCRQRVALLTEDRALREKLAKAGPVLHPDDCRKYYDERITSCADELVVMYACSVGQSAADDSRTGGVYSSNLLDASKGWTRESNIDTNSKYSILSVVSAHEKAVSLVERSRGGRQTPHIEKPRIDPYFPFCIVA
ncbi:MAG: caspase family protein, partial [Candidatus Acidiferrum sp.]